MKRNRATPRIWHTDWLLLRALARRLREQAERHIQPNTFMIDFGYGDSPYAEMMRQLNINYCGADHVRDLDAYCAEIRRLLNDDGLLLLSTHGTWLYHPHPEDHRRWTRTGLISDLTDRGFVVEEVDALVGPLATTTIIRLTGFAFFIRRLPLIGGVLASGLAVMMNLRAMSRRRKYGMTTPAYFYFVPGKHPDENSHLFYLSLHFWLLFPGT